MPEFNINNAKADIDKIVSDYTKSLGKYAAEAGKEIIDYMVIHEEDYKKWTEAFANTEITESQLKTMALGEKLVIEAISLKWLLRASIETNDKAKKIALIMAQNVIKTLISLIKNVTIPI